MRKAVFSTEKWIAQCSGHSPTLSALESQSRANQGSVVANPICKCRCHKAGHLQVRVAPGRRSTCVLKDAPLDKGPLGLPHKRPKTPKQCKNACKTGRAAVHETTGHPPSIQGLPQMEKTMRNLQSEILARLKRKTRPCSRMAISVRWHRVQNPSNLEIQGKQSPRQKMTIFVIFLHLFEFSGRSPGCIFLPCFFRISRFEGSVCSVPPDWDRNRRNWQTIRRLRNPAFGNPGFS